jgi:hypothetical protein
MRLLIAAVVVNLAVATSLGPILGFFTLSTKSYPFMIFLTVVVLGLAGAVGLAFLLRTLRRLALVSLGDDLPERPVPPGPPPQDAEPGPEWSAYSRELATFDRLVAERASAASLIFHIWVVLYGLVGLQTGWLLRPFIGNPEATEFSWLRERDGNAFLALWRTLGDLLGS